MRKIPFHPFLFAAYPVLFLYARNASLFSLDVIFIPSLVALLVAAVLFLINYRLLADRDLAATLSSSIILVFLLYRPAYDLSSPQYKPQLGKVFLQMDVLVFFLICFLGLAWSILFLRTKFLRRLPLSMFLSLTSVILVALPIFQIARSEVEKLSIKSKPVAERVGDETTSAKTNSPHIFYFILDGYGRSDVLKELYGFDNTPFLSELEKRGFQDFSSALSNYAKTNLSLASSLNMTYLEELQKRVGKYASSHDPLFDMIRHNQVVSTLRKHGYRFASFSSGVHATELSNADIYIVPQWDLGEFNNALLNLTPIPVMIKLINRELKVGGADLFRERILFTFKQVPELAKLKQPLFVFVHFLSPHPPFVFARDGSPVNIPRLMSEWDGSHIIGKNGVTVEEYRRHYIEQVIFLNQKLLKAVDEIRAHESRPSVLIFQGDHGPGSELDHESLERTNLHERFSILQAIRMPNQGGPNQGGTAPSDLTPVNTFRYLFNSYLASDYELLENRFFFSKDSTPFDFTAIGMHSLAKKAQGASPSIVDANALD